MQDSNPLGPTNYTGSNTTISKYTLVDRVQASTTIAKSSNASIKDECKLDSQTERRKNRIASDAFLYYIKDYDHTQ